MTVLDPPRSRPSSGAWTLIGILVGLAILAAMLRAVGFAAISDALGSVKPLPLLAAGGCR